MLEKEKYIFKSTIPFRENYLKDIMGKICEDTVSKMFMITLFIIVKYWQYLNDQK